MSINTDITGLRSKIRKALTYLDADSLLNLIGADQLKWVNDNFQKEGIESPWPVLSENTVAARRGASSKPLQDTGKLRQSFNYSVSGNVVRIGSNLKIAPFHEHGTSAYPIKPKSGRKLRFMTANGPVFASKVNHPGIPQRKMLPTKNLTAKLAVQSIESTIQQMRQDIGGN